MRGLYGANLTSNDVQTMNNTGSFGLAFSFEPI